MNETFIFLVRAEYDVVDWYEDQFEYVADYPHNQESYGAIFKTLHVFFPVWLLALGEKVLTFLVELNDRSKYPLLIWLGRHFNVILYIN